MTGAAGSGPSTGGVMAQPAPAQPLVPATTSIADRITECEQKLTNLYDINSRTERITMNLINQNQELRDQLGLTPLAPDYFS